MQLVFNYEGHEVSAVITVPTGRWADGRPYEPVGAGMHWLGVPTPPRSMSFRVRYAFSTQDLRERRRHCASISRWRLPS